MKSMAIRSLLVACSIPATFSLHGMQYLRQHRVFSSSLPGLQNLPSSGRPPNSHSYIYFPSQQSALRDHLSARPLRYHRGLFVPSLTHIEDILGQTTMDFSAHESLTPGKSSLGLVFYGFKTLRFQSPEGYFSLNQSSQKDEDIEATLEEAQHKTRTTLQRVLREEKKLNFHECQVGRYPWYAVNTALSKFGLSLYDRNVKQKVKYTLPLFLTRQNLPNNALLVIDYHDLEYYQGLRGFVGCIILNTYQLCEKKREHEISSAIEQQLYTVAGRKPRRINTPVVHKIEEHSLNQQPETRFHHSENCR